jgi:hypothetical protein
MSKTKLTTETVAAPVVQVVPDFDAMHLTGLTTVASKIRYLDSCGLKRGQIARTLNIRYQWVRNVLITPVKKS